MVFLFLSWTLSVWALRKPQLALPLSAGGTIAFALSLANSEYFLGLELLRPVLLWLVLSETAKSRAQRFRRTLVAWVPYLTIWAAFVFWRLFIFGPTRGVAAHQVPVLKHLKANPLHWTAARLWSVSTDLVQATMTAWRPVVSRLLILPDFAQMSVKLLLSVLFILASCVLVGIWYAWRCPSAVKNSSRINSGRNEWHRQALVVSALAMVLGGLPAWFIERHIKLDSLDDRYTLALMAGACLVVTTALFYVIRSRKQQVLVLSLILGLSAGFHFQNANYYRGCWSDQKSTCWQLWWRAPQLAGGSCLIAMVPRSEFDGRSMALPIDMIYSPKYKDTMLDYWVSEVTQLTPQDTAIDWIGLPHGPLFRDIYFSGSRTRSVAAFVSKTGCLWLVDSLRENLPDLPTLTRFAVPISHPESVVFDETCSRVAPRSASLVLSRGMIGCTTSRRQNSDASWPTSKGWFGLGTAPRLSPFAPMTQSSGCPSSKDTRWWEDTRPLSPLLHQFSTRNPRPVVCWLTCSAPWFSVPDCPIARWSELPPSGKELTSRPNSKAWPTTPAHRRTACCAHFPPRWALSFSSLCGWCLLHRLAMAFLS